MLTTESKDLISPCKLRVRRLRCMHGTLSVKIRVTTHQKSLTFDSASFKFIYRIGVTFFVL